MLLYGSDHKLPLIYGTYLQVQLFRRCRQCYKSDETRGPIDLDKDDLEEKTRKISTGILQYKWLSQKCIITNAILQMLFED